MHGPFNGDRHDVLTATLEATLLNGRRSRSDDHYFTIDEVQIDFNQFREDPDAGLTDEERGARALDRITNEMIEESRRPEPKIILARR